MELILNLLAGTALGTLTGLGVGGGSLLLLWLTLVMGMEPSTARSISLLFFFPAAALSCLFRRGTIPWKAVLPAIVTGCIAAGIFTGLSQTMDREILRKLFGFVLLLVGIRELRYREKK